MKDAFYSRAIRCGESAGDSRASPRLVATTLVSRAAEIADAGRGLRWSGSRSAACAMLIGWKSCAWKRIRGDAIPPHSSQQTECALLAAVSSRVLCMRVGVDALNVGLLVTPIVYALYRRALTAVLRLVNCPMRNLSSPAIHPPAATMPTALPRRYMERRGKGN